MSTRSERFDNVAHALNLRKAGDMISISRDEDLKKPVEVFIGDDMVPITTADAIASLRQTTHPRNKKGQEIPGTRQITITSEKDSINIKRNW
jgi:hypothetical protein